MRPSAYERATACPPHEERAVREKNLHMVPLGSLCDMRALHT